MEEINSPTRYSLFGLNEGKEPVLIRKYHDAKPAIAHIQEEAERGQYQNFYVMLYGKILIYAAKLNEQESL